ncbi:hypothetical protein CWE12_13535 [Aliidiomarina sedimenti]|uniref:Phage holin family protein n=1 Tax=Aliidiomarina sedimenti TaxID=1933879 RepID=A0ABY0BUT2_9GAMM|nr:hypothetical protein [Aliidiomarina sedimenti]RUO27947.1 hypothetical protein CWE12_13535 [Aliidiomarina sedimenti]
MRGFILFCLLLAALFWLAPGVLSAIFAGAISITVSGLTALIIVGVVMLVVGTVFGSLLLAGIAGAIALLFVGFSLLWPLLLVFLLIWLLTRDRTQHA